MVIVYRYLEFNSSSSRYEYAPRHATKEAIDSRLGFVLLETAMKTEVKYLDARGFLRDDCVRHTLRASRRKSPLAAASGRSHGSGAGPDARDCRGSSEA